MGSGSRPREMAARGAVPIDWSARGSRPVSMNPILAGDVAPRHDDVARTKGQCHVHGERLDQDPPLECIGDLAIPVVGPGVFQHADCLTLHFDDGTRGACSHRRPMGQGLPRILSGGTCPTSPSSAPFDQVSLRGRF